MESKPEMTAHRSYLFFYWIIPLPFAPVNFLSCIGPILWLKVNLTPISWEFHGIPKKCQPLLHTHHYILTYLSFFAHTDIFWRLPTGLAIAVRLFCIQMTESQLCLVLSISLMNTNNWGLRGKKEKPGIFSIASPWGDSSDTWLSYFISLRKGTSVKESP